MPDAGISATAAIEKALLGRIDEVYAEALKTAMKRSRAFLQAVEDVDSGKKKPHPSYNTPEKVAKWRQGYTDELLRRHGVINNIARALRDAGAELAPDIRDALAEVYKVNAEYTGQALTVAAKRAGINVSFSMPTVKQARIILEDAQPVMSKIAFNNLQNAPALIRRLQNEMTQAVLLGENQDRLIRRIRDVMQDGRKRAKRIAQTEGTRVQSQARYNTLKDGAAMGINVRRRWSTRMVNSRETHIALNGKTVGMDENFVTTAGNVLRYPGDPTAPAAEVVNCHCVVVPVVKTGEGAADGLQRAVKNGIIKNVGAHLITTDKQFGKKVGKHAADYGLDPSKPKDRARIRKTIESIFETPDEIAHGEWHGQTVPTKFFIKGEDVVVTTEDNVFITLLKGGISNARVKNARRKQI